MIVTYSGVPVVFGMAQGRDFPVATSSDTPMFSRFANTPAAASSYLTPASC